MLTQCCAGVRREGEQLLARAVWLVGLDEVGPHLGTSLDGHEDIPIWHWITFIPQLLAGLGRPEARFLQSILMQLVKVYPQSMYCPLRTALFEIRERIAARQPPPQVRRQRQRVWDDRRLCASDVTGCEAAARLAGTDVGARGGSSRGIRAG